MASEGPSMGREIERKFLVAGEAWRALAEGTWYRQGYLSRDRERTVRLRSAGGRGFLTIKGISVGATRAEYEYEIPHDECRAMLDSLAERPLIEKMRYRIEWGGLIWEIDEFFGDNRGLVLAEVELEREGQEFDRPEWIGDEVTGDPRYFNANLVRHPFAGW